MTAPRHTPGPWQVNSRPTAANGDDDDEGWWFELHAKADQSTYAEHIANARLMENAPNMLAALTGAADYLDALHDNMIANDVDMAIDKNESPRVVADRLRAAIAKAKGE